MALDLSLIEQLPQRCPARPVKREQDLAWTQRDSAKPELESTGSWQPNTSQLQQWFVFVTPVLVPNGKI